MRAFSGQRFTKWEPNDPFSYHKSQPRWAWVLSMRASSDPVAGGFSGTKNQPPSENGLPNSKSPASAKAMVLPESVTREAPRGPPGFHAGWPVAGKVFGPEGAVTETVVPEPSFNGALKVRSRPSAASSSGNFNPLAHRSKAPSASFLRVSTVFLATSIAPSRASHRARSLVSVTTTMLGLESFTLPSNPPCWVFRKKAAME